MATTSWQLCGSPWPASAGDADGLFHNDTRFVSHLELLVNGQVVPGYVQPAEKPR